MSLCAQHSYGFFKTKDIPKLKQVNIDWRFEPQVSEPALNTTPNFLLLLIFLRIVFPKTIIKYCSFLRLATHWNVSQCLLSGPLSSGLVLEFPLSSTSGTASRWLTEMIQLHRLLQSGLNHNHKFSLDPHKIISIPNQQEAA